MLLVDANLKLKFEDLIRQGQILAVKSEIEDLKPSQIPRDLWADFADIARRVRSEAWGLRLLRSVVRSETPVHPPVTEAEKCSYAGLLVKFGSLPEAQDILNAILENPILSNGQRLNALNFQSQIYILQWDYKKALPVLKQMIAHSEISEYPKCIAQVNLAGAYLFLNKLSEAQSLLPKVLETCQAKKWDLLYGNALELSAQLAVLQKNWAEAENLLQKAQAHSGQHSHYGVFIEKWRMIASLWQTEPQSNAMDQVVHKIESLQKKATTLESWETIRDLDYQLALHRKHPDLLFQVYFGTPHLEFKKRIEAICKKNGWKIPSSFIRKLTSQPTVRVLDLNEGAESGQPVDDALKPGQMLHRFLNVLAMDFYKPIGTGDLFSKVFPGEYFNPDTSPSRLSQAATMLRAWFQSQNMPLEIEVSNGRYFLKADGPYALKISRQPRSSEALLDSGYENSLQKLKQRWPYQSFSAAKAADELGISQTNVRGLIQRACDEKRLFKSGAGRSTLYRFEK